MAKAKQPPGSAMTFGNMSDLGCEGIEIGGKNKKAAREWPSGPLLGTAELNSVP